MQFVFKYIVETTRGTVCFSVYFNIQNAVTDV